MLMTPSNTTTPFASPQVASPQGNFATHGSSVDDIERRILEVRASWNVQERIRRRRAAEERFGHLVETLLIDDAH